jgi:two-component system catabolic regulation response regulator CreB
MKTKILLVEDEGGIVDNIIYALKTDGFDIKWCSTGHEALLSVKNEHISLIILDVGLPDINGFELFKEIRKTTQIPVIFLTARSEEVDRIVGLEMGADDYVTKPFSPRELSARIKAVLRRFKKGKTDNDKISAIIPFTLDKNKKSISYMNKTLPMSFYEYKILEVLILHPGWVYSRAQLMQKVWEDPEVSEDRTIDTHIKNIRSKLKKITPDCDPILTHRGIGYSLKEDW